MILISILTEYFKESRIEPRSPATKTKKMPKIWLFLNGKTKFVMILIQ